MDAKMLAKAAILLASLVKFPKNQISANCHFIWHTVWHPIWHSFWHIFWPSIWQYCWHSILLYSDILFGIRFYLACILRSYLIWHSIRHLFWHPIWSWHSFRHVFGSVCPAKSGAPYRLRVEHKRTAVELAMSFDCSTWSGTCCIGAGWCPQWRQAVLLQEEGRRRREEGRKGGREEGRKGKDKRSCTFPGRWGKKWLAVSE